MTSISQTLLWLLLEDDTGRLLIDRQATARALTVAARADAEIGATHTSDAALPPGQLRERSLRSLQSTHRVRRATMRSAGFWPSACWPTTDPLGKQAERRTLQWALFDAQPPGPATRILIATLHTVDALAAQCPQWARYETMRCARRIIHSDGDCTRIVESLRRADRRALAQSFSLGARPLFAGRPA